MHHLAIDFYSP